METTSTKRRNVSIVCGFLAYTKTFTPGARNPSGSGQVTAVTLQQTGKEKTDKQNVCIYGLSDVKHRISSNF